MAIDKLIASYPRHEDAEEAVDRLVHRRFPVQHLAIVGRNIAMVERVTGPMGFFRLGLIGSIIGFFIGTILGSLLIPSLLTVPGMIVGAMVGALVGTTLRALNYSHDFSAETRHGSGRYALMADESKVAEDARRILAESAPRH